MISHLIRLCLLCLVCAIGQTSIVNAQNGAACAAVDDSSNFEQGAGVIGGSNLAANFDAAMCRIDNLTDGASGFVARSGNASYDITTQVTDGAGSVPAFWGCAASSDPAADTDIFCFINNVNTSGSFGFTRGYSFSFGSDITNFTIGGIAYASGTRLPLDFDTELPATAVSFVKGGNTYNFTISKPDDSNTFNAFTMTVGPPEINLLGGGNSIPSGTAASVANDTDFGALDVASGTDTHTFTIQNTGTGPLTITSVTSDNPGEFAVNDSGVGSPIAVGGMGTFTVTFDPSAAGARSATITIANDDADEGTFTLPVAGSGTLSATTTTIVATPSPSSVLGQGTQVSVTVSSAAGTPSGDVTLWVDGVARRTRALNASGRVVFTLNLGLGVHSIRAVYAGNVTLAGSSSGDTNHTVTQAVTTTALSISNSGVSSASSAGTTSLPGETVNLVADVTAVPPASGMPPPSGNVRFQIGALRLGSQSLDGLGQASLSTPSIPVGVHDIVAIYQGASRYAGSTSPAAQHTVTPRVGAELPVNSTTAGDQSEPVVALLPNNIGHVVVWTSNGQDGSGKGVFAQRYDMSGAPLGGEVLVNTTTAGDQTDPAVAAFSDGAFIVTWTGPDANDTGIYSQKFDATGAKDGGETLVNSTTAGPQALSAVAVLAGGNGHVVVWQAWNGTDFDVVAQRFDSMNVNVGGETTVNITTAGKQLAPAVFVLDDGFVTVWRSIPPGGGTESIVAHQIAASGASLGGEVQIHDSASSRRKSVAIGQSSDNKTVIAWAELATDGTGWNVFARFATAGSELLSTPFAPDGSSFRLHEQSARNQLQPSIIKLPRSGIGGFLAVWTSFDGSDSGIFAQHIGASGNRLYDNDARVNSFVTGAQSEPAVAWLLHNNQAMVVWSSAGQDGSGNGVYSQRLGFFVLPTRAPATTEIRASGR